MQEVRAENAARKMRAKKFPTPSYWDYFNYDRRWPGMMTKMKKMNILNYQVTHFARNNKKNVHKAQLLSYNENVTVILKLK